jgi:hypothetical protein
MKRQYIKVDPKAKVQLLRLVVLYSYSVKEASLLLDINYPIAKHYVRKYWAELRKGGKSLRPKRIKLESYCGQIGNELP